MRKRGKEKLNFFPRQNLLLFSLILLCVLLPGCSSTASTPQSNGIDLHSEVSVPTFDDPASSLQTTYDPDSRNKELVGFITETNQARKKLFTSETQFDFSPYTPEFSDELDLLSPDEIKAFVKEKERRVVSKQEALEDIDLLFRALKSSYGPYVYFGGDDIFFPIRDAVNNEITELSEIEPDVLEEILIRHLSSVIIDGHFYIGNTRAIQNRALSMYYVPGLFFDQSESVDSKLVQPTIGPEGNICYWFCTLSFDATTLPSQTEINGHTYSLNWQPAYSEPSSGGAAFFESDKNGIPVLSLRQLHAESDSAIAQLNAFSASGSEYRETPLFCLDVRGNGGGTSDWGNIWLSGFTGTSDFFQAGSAKKATTFANEIFSIADYPLFSESDLGHWIIDSQKGGWVERDAGQIAFVLIDSNSASAAEDLVASLRACGNTLFIGSNSAGCYLGSDNVVSFLPNSGLPCCWATGFCLTESGENIDGRGFLPDLWVAPEDALDAVARLCDYYGLLEAAE